MSEIRFSLVGPGRVGRSLAAWLVAAGARIDQIAARDSRSAVETSRTLGGRASTLEELDSSRQDVLLVTVADEALPTVARRLAARSQAPVALHVSGASDAEVLAALRESGSRVGTLHPLRAFPAASTDLGDGQGVVFTLDGDPEAVVMADRIARTIGGMAIPIDPASRPLYHLAASLAAGGVVTLLAVADELAARLGLPDEVGAAYLALARQAVEQAATSARPAAALTGPVARGDAAVVERQMSALSVAAPDLVEVVAAVAREALRQRRRHHGRTGADDELERILARRFGESG